MFRKGGDNQSSDQRWMSRKTFLFLNVETIEGKRRGGGRGVGRFSGLEETKFLDRSK